VLEQLGVFGDHPDATADQRQAKLRTLQLRTNLLCCGVRCRVDFARHDVEARLTKRRVAALDPRGQRRLVDALRHGAVIQHPRMQADRDHAGICSKR
jgi:hypothetical protein